MINKYLAILLISITALSSCKKDDDPDIPNEEEVITTLKYVLVNNLNTNDTATFIFKDFNENRIVDASGDTLVVDSLQSGAIYTGTIEFLNELKSPADTVTNEIKEEAIDHQVIYTSAGGNTISYTDNEADYDAADCGNAGKPECGSASLPVGITTTFTVGSTTENLTITLLHEPVKGSGGSVSGGETDITATFPSVKVY